MSVQKRRLTADEKRKYLRDLSTSQRPPISRARRLESDVDLGQLPGDPPVIIADPTNGPKVSLGGSKLGSDGLG